MKASTRQFTVPPPQKVNGVFVNIPSNPVQPFKREINKYSYRTKSLPKATTTNQKYKIQQISSKLNWKRTC